MFFLANLCLILMTVNLLFYLALFFSFIFNRQASLAPYLLTEDRFPGNLKSPPRVSVLIPARNEEENIGNCLNSLFKQDFPNLEIIVIDDQSTDGTARIVEEFQEKSKSVKLIRGKKLPPGWIGKNYALCQGVQKARGEYLLFLDADVMITSPKCITQTVSYAMEYDSDLLTMVPRLICITFWEKVVLPLLGFLIVNRFTLKKINDPSSPVTSVIGPYLFFKKETYEKIGGHERIKGEIVEDLVLARTMKKEGYRLSYLLGTDLFSLREYTSFGGIWEGFSKNFFVGMDKKVWAAILCTLIIFIVLVLPWLSIPVGFGCIIFYGCNTFVSIILIQGILSCLLTMGIRRLLKKLGDLNDTYAFLQPLGALVLMAILVNSTIRISFNKGVSWKGRIYLDS